MIRRPPRSTQSRSSAASDVYKRQGAYLSGARMITDQMLVAAAGAVHAMVRDADIEQLSLIHISEPTRLLSISYAVFCLKKKKNTNKHRYLTHDT